jgi:hypothetical protein
MGLPTCIIEFHGKDKSYEVSATMDDNPFGQSPTTDLLECRVEKRLSIDAPAGVFEIQLSKDKDKNGETWRDKVRPQDTVVIQMMNYQGRSDSTGAGQMHTVMIGFVDTISIGTSISPKGIPQRVIVVRGTDFGKIFKTGVVTYWTFLGATLLDDKTGKAYNFVDPRKLSQHPNQIAATLVEELFSRFMDIRFTVRQKQYTIFDMLRQQLESYGDFPANLDMQFLSGEGNFWSFFVKLCSPPFHELWVDTRRSVDVLVNPDEELDATFTTRDAHLLLGRDGSCPTLIMRPTPFPYLKPPAPVTFKILPTEPQSGVLLLPEVTVTDRLERTRWDGLRRHVVGSNPLAGEPYDEMLSISDQEAHNFYLIYGHYPALPEKPYLLSVPGIIDRKRFKRYGYKPMIPTSSLLQTKEMGTPDDPLGVFYSDLTWRLASWNVLNDLFESGYKSFKLLPHIHVGDVITDESDWQDSTKQFYVETVVHHYRYNVRATTTLGLTRGLTTKEYADIGEVLLDQGLERMPPSEVVDTYNQLTGAR